MAEANKETVYIDIDDEITAIIDKVRSAKHKIVALVLPRRATTLQSIVNMKLLKRTAKEESKQIVLITSEAGLLPLAGAVGLHVAKTLQSKPEIPSPPDVSDNKETLVDADSGDDEPIDSTKTVGELAGVAAVASVAKDKDDDTIDVDNSGSDEPAKSPKSKDKKNKIKVPNFDKFRKRFLLGGLVAILLIIFAIFAFKVWPSAAINIKTNNATADVNFNFTASTDAQSVDKDTNTVPAIQKDSQQTDSQKVAATGEKNVGEKASGSVVMSKTTNCASQVTSIAAGATITANGKSFTTQDQASFPGPPSIQGGKCVWTSNGVDVVAQNAGTDSNLAAGTQFTVNGSSATATNSNAFSGGTDKTITVVSQSDIDKAKKQITNNNDVAVKDLQKKFQDDNLFAITASILPGKQTVSSSSKVGDEATEVTVTVETDYTMLGVKRDDLKALVEGEVKKDPDKAKQKLADDGLDKAKIEVTSKKSGSNQTFSVETTASTGAQIDSEALKQQIKGKKKGDVEHIVQAIPGVDSVNVHFSPFWVNKVPAKTSKITINVENTQPSSSNDQSQ